MKKLEAIHVRTPRWHAEGQPALAERGGGQGLGLLCAELRR